MLWVLTCRSRLSPAPAGTYLGNGACFGSRADQQLPFKALRSLLDPLIQYIQSDSLLRLKQDGGHWSTGWRGHPPMDVYSTYRRCNLRSSNLATSYWLLTALLGVYAPSLSMHFNAFASGSYL